MVGGLLGAGVFAGGGGLNVYTVLRNGGIYIYAPGGQLFPANSLSGAEPKFKTSACTGSSYIAFGGAALPPNVLSFYRGLFGGAFRLTYRSTAGVDFGPARAWRFKGATETVAAGIDVFKLQSDGSCALDATGFTGTLFKFDRVPAPPDFKGPLRIR